MAIVILLREIGERRSLLCRLNNRLKRHSQLESIKINLNSQSNSKVRLTLFGYVAWVDYLNGTKDFFVPLSRKKEWQLPSYLEKWLTELRLHPNLCLLIDYIFSSSAKVIINKHLFFLSLICIWITSHCFSSAKYLLSNLTTKVWVFKEVYFFKNEPLISWTFLGRFFHQN